LGASQEVVDQLTSFGAKANMSWGFPSKVKPRAIGVIEKNAVAKEASFVCGVEGKVKGKRFVKRIILGIVA
jgi:hypothetical protein